MFTIYGRLNRKAFLVRLAMAFALYLVGTALVLLGHSSEGINLLLTPFLFVGSGFLLLCFVFLWFGVVRRLHDINLSGWWSILVYLVPICIFILCFWPGTPGPNRYDVSY